MNPHSQRLAIAKSAGWTDIKLLHGVGYQSGWSGVYKGRVKLRRYSGHLPNYLTSRGDMAEALESLSTDKRFNYWLHLWHIVHGDQFDYASASPNACVKCLLAKPAQQAEAYLKALDLWSEEPHPLNQSNHPIS